jgi:hypothetical protein
MFLRIPEALLCLAWRLQQIALCTDAPPLLSHSASGFDAAALFLSYAMWRIQQH